MQEASGPLGYAPPIPWYHRKRYQRVIQGGGVGLLILAVYYYWGQDAWRQAVYLYWQHQAMTHAPPTPQVVYESDPTEAAKLIRSDPQYESVPYVSKDGIPARGPAGAAYVSEAATKTGIVGASFGTILVHRRATAEGHERLAYIGFYLQESDSGRTR